MPVLTFFKWSPGGNATLLFPAADFSLREQARLASAALEPSCLGGEQAGFFSLATGHLRMAGGEFCLNATRAFGALLAFMHEEHEVHDHGSNAHNACPGHEQRFTVQVSGAHSPIALRANGFAPHWRVEATLLLPPCPITTVDTGIDIVHLPGITHILLHTDLHPSPDDFSAAATLLRERYGLEHCAAVGTIWWSRRQNQLEMLPLVHVRDPHSDCLESACGSGALALALCLGRSKVSATSEAEQFFSIMQPAGTALDIRLRPQGDSFSAAVDGPVSLVARGTVYLPEATA